MTREQLIADREAFDAQNRLLHEEYQRVLDCVILIEEVIKQRVASRQGIKQMDLATLVSKLDDIRTKLAEIIQLRRG